MLHEDRLKGFPVPGAWEHGSLLYSLVDLWEDDDGAVIQMPGKPAKPEDADHHEQHLDRLQKEIKNVSFGAIHPN